MEERQHLSQGANTDDSMMCKQADCTLFLEVSL